MANAAYMDGDRDTCVDNTPWTLLQMHEECCERSLHSVASRSQGQQLLTVPAGGSRDVTDVTSLLFCTVCGITLLVP